MLGILFAWCLIVVRGKLLQQKNVKFFPPFVTAELPFFKQTIVDHTIASYRDYNLAEMWFQENSDFLFLPAYTRCTFKMTKKHTLDFPLMKLCLGIFW